MRVKSRRRPGPLAGGAVILLAAVALACLPPAAGQMETPLKGQGAPDNATTDVYLSVYLDRLLEVDERNYRHQNIAYFYLTWNDPSAFETVTRTTAEWLAGNRSCERECTDWAGDVACCDAIYLPTFFLRNVYALPQDRATGYKMVVLAPPQTSVAWYSFVQATYYQPMDLTHFPFDSWDLLVTLEFMDTSLPGHPGVAVHTSSAGTSLYTVGRGDPVSQWGIQGINLQAQTGMISNPAKLFQSFSYVPSNPDDPLGLTTTPAAVLRGCRPGPATLAATRNATQVSVRIRIKRFSGYHVLNTVLPVLLLGLLSLIVFFLERSDLSSRLGIVVTLFLAMAAVQFVISESQPASSYALPTQMAAIATYCLLTFIAVESIVVYRIETWQEHHAKKAALLAARQQRLAQRKAAEAAAAADEGEGRGVDLHLQQPQDDAMAANGLHCAVGIGSHTPYGDLGVDGKPSMSQACLQPQEQRQQQKQRGGTSFLRCFGRRKRETVAHCASHEADASSDVWLAYCTDRCSFVVCSIGYTVAIVCIYTLNSGYINLFPNLPPWEL